MLLTDDQRVIKFTHSLLCHRRIEADCEIFGVNESHLIELVICDFCEWSDRVTYGDKKVSLDNIYKLISDGGEIRFFKSIVRIITNNNQRHSYTKSVPYLWTVTLPARKALCDNDFTSEAQNSFCNDIIEEYSQMNFSTREKIILRDKIAVIERAIKHNNLIQYTKGDGTKKTVSPYKIVVEPDTQYNYLIISNEDNGGKPGSIRLCMMNEITELRQKRKIDAKSMEQELSDRNIAYLKNEEIEVEIGLTKNGEDIYSRVIPNRPKLISKDKEKTGDYRIYRFKCTEFQAKVYFNSFGKEAKIISPESLKEEIKKFYEEALGIGITEQKDEKGKTGEKLK